MSALPATSRPRADGPAPGASAPRAVFAEGSAAGYGLLALLVAALLLLPLALAPTSYVLHLLFSVFVFAVMGHAWNLLAGYCGLLSFGNQVYVGVGGFAMAIAWYYWAFPLWLAWLTAGVAALAFAWLLAVPLSPRREGRGLRWPLAIAVLLWIGYEALVAWRPGLDVFQSDYVRRVAIVLLIFLGALPLLKLQGAYFAIATWLVAESVATVFNEWMVVGAGGGMQLKSTVTLTQLYYAALVLLIVSTAGVWRLLRSRYGVGLTAVRDDEEAAQTVGIDIRRVKTHVFLISAALTGLAAGLYFLDAVIITPPSGFALSWSAYLVFIVVAGGMGTLAGPIIGAALFIVIDRLLAGGAGGGLLALGIASILLIFFLPRGVMGLVHDLRQPRGQRTGGGGERWARVRRALLGDASVRLREHEQPGVVGAWLVPGSPLPLLVPDNPPWQPVVAGLDQVRARLAELQPDVLLVYSTQWLAVLDELWQCRPRLSGLQVDDNWHDLGTLRFDLRIDTTLARACVRACQEAGIASKAVDYDHFPVDIGTIAANAAINPHGEIPLVIAANNLYHDFDTTRKLGELAVQTAIEQGKRVAVIAIGGLSGTMFRDERPLTEDRVASASDDAWNQQVLAKIEAARIEELLAELPQYARDARVDMGFKHFAWLLGCMKGEYKRARVLGYGPAYGAGGAVVEFIP